MHGGLYFSFSQKSVFLKHPTAHTTPSIGDLYCDVISRLEYSATETKHNETSFGGGIYQDLQFWTT